MKESDLFQPVKQFLINDMGCQKVYAEVCNHDVVALTGEQTIIVEMKMMLNFKVIEQAIHAKEKGNYVFIAVPHKKSGFPNIVNDFLKYHGVGLIVVRDGYANIPYGMFAKYNRKVSDIKPFIKDGYHDTITGGCKMGDFDYQSDYTLMIDSLKEFFRRRPNKWFTVNEILEHVQCYYRSPKPQLAATLKAHWNHEWVEHKIINRKSHFKYKDN